MIDFEILKILISIEIKNLSSEIQSFHVRALKTFNESGFRIFKRLK